MKAQAYVGITGAVSENEVDFIAREFNRVGYTLESRHLPMLGFLVSLKTLNGEDSSNRRYPKVENIRHLVERTQEKIFPMIHYNSREKTTLADQLDNLFYSLYHDNLCNAVQLNMVYPDIKQLEKTKKKMPDLKIVFQANSSVMKGKEPKKLAKTIKEYGDLIDYVLIDPSGGKGREFNLDNSIVIYNELRESTPNLTLGFAGGFTGENVEGRVKTLIESFRSDDFCIDSEGGLRDKLSEEYGDDLLNRDKVRRYLKQSSNILN